MSALDWAIHMLAMIEALDEDGLITRSMRRCDSTQVLFHWQALKRELRLVVNRVRSAP